MEGLVMRSAKQPLPSIPEEQQPRLPARQRKVTFSSQPTQFTDRKELDKKGLPSPDFSLQFRTLSNVKPEKVTAWAQPNFAVSQFRSVVSKPESAIRKILATPQPPFLKFESRYDFLPPEPEQLQRVPELYTLDYSNDYQRESYLAIFRQLSHNLRDRMKPSQRPTSEPSSIELSTTAKEPILNLKKLDFKVYSDIIEERDSNQLFSSVISNYGTLQLDQEIEGLPDKYEIREKKKMSSIQINTEENEQYYTRLSVFESVGTVEMLQLEIEREKSRRPRAKDYLDIMQAKLLELLDCVLHDERDYDGLPFAQRLKKILSQLDQFKGKKVEGTSKTNILLYFFREYKELRDLQLQNMGTPRPKDTPSRSLKTVRKETRPQPSNIIQTVGFSIPEPTPGKYSGSAAKASASRVQPQMNRQQKPRSSLSPVPLARRQPLTVHDENAWIGHP